MILLKTKLKQDLRMLVGRQLDKVVNNAADKVEDVEIGEAVNLSGQWID